MEGKQGNNWINIVVENVEDVDTKIQQEKSDILKIFHVNIRSIRKKLGNLISYC